jgi:hypothetical protein
MTSDLQSLLSRLETATEGSRELDAEIDAALRIGKPSLPDWARTNFPTWRARPDGRVECAHGDGTGSLHWESQPFTRSVDAALSLVPEGFYWNLRVGRNVITATVQSPFGTSLTPQWVHEEAEAETPALALVVAALRARGPTDTAAAGSGDPGSR